MSARGKFYLSIVVIIGVGGLLWSLLPDQETPPERNLPRTFLKSPPNQAPEAKTAYSEASKLQVSEEILQEVKRSGQIDRDPAATEERLNQLARNLKPDEIKTLAEIVKTPSNNGDLRALAVELLARNESEEVLHPLEEIIFSEWQESRDVRLNEFERILRARAVEGVQGNSSPEASSVLARGSEHIEDEFIKDRSQRALLHREGKAPKAQDQDQEALEKILQE